MELWSLWHVKTLLPAFAIMIVLTLVLRLWLGKKELKIRMIPLQIVAVLLIILEIGKQALSISRGYDLYCLPFHFCSMFIFMLPLAAFYKGKHANAVRGITAALSMSVLALMLIYPCLIYSAGNIELFFRDFMSLHTVAFHNLVMFAALLIPGLELHEPCKTDVKRNAVFVLCFCVVSATMAHLLKTNFNNFYVCNIPPLETVRQAVETACGTVPAMLMYVLIVTVLDISFVFGAYWLYRLVRNMMVKKQVTV